MTDKELLGLAAKAAGMEIHWPQDHWMDWQTPYCNGRNWNPLTDDGDAFRLAVKLKIDTYLYDDRVVCRKDDYFDHCSDYYNEDPCSATRRAIVLAATEIGRGMR